MENDLKQMVRSIMEPVLDCIVDNVMILTEAMSKNMPASVPQAERTKMLEGIIKGHADSLKASIESSVPKDFDAKLKEAVDGGK